MFDFISTEEMFISLLSGYNIYFDTKNIANILLYEKALIVRHVHSNEIYYAVPIVAPDDFFTNDSFKQDWKRLIEYPCNKTFIWPVDLVFISADVSKCYLLYEYVSCTNLKSISSLFISDKNYVGVENSSVHDMVLKIIDAFVSVEKSDYLYLGLDDDKIYYNTKTSSILIPVVEEMSVGRNKNRWFTSAKYLSEVLDPYGYANRKVSQGKEDVYAYDFYSERYAVVSIIFKLLIGIYPYEGPFMEEYEYNVNSSDNLDWIHRYIQNPVFIFDPTDASNSIEIYKKNDVHRNRWGMLSDKLKTMFIDSLEQRNVLRYKENKSYSAVEWKKALLEFFDNRFDD